MENYLENRKQLTVINGIKSSTRNVGYGVPQGSVLGPQLFTLFINDIANHVNYSNIQMYADDIVLYNTVENNMNEMQLDLANVVEWWSTECRSTDF